MLGYHALSKTWVRVVSALMLCFGVQASAQDQINLLEFVPAPSSGSTAEFVFTGSVLGNGSGTIGTGFGTLDDGDGDLPIADQDATGLLLTSPFQVFGSPGSDVDSGSEGTTFFDATLLVTGVLAALGDAVATPLTDIGQTVLSQALGGGTIEIWSTDPLGGGEDPILLLSATISSAAILGFEGSQTGSILSADLVYTGGLVLSQAGFLPDTAGELSFSLLDIEPALSIDSSTDQLAAFQTDATGLFSIVPEPSSALILLTSAGLLALRRRQTS